jgi:hypothetical protein
MVQQQGSLEQNSNQSAGGVAEPLLFSLHHSRIDILLSL